MIDGFLGWLGATPWSVALLESRYAWAFNEAAHVLTIALFVGTTVMMDLRLMGWAFKDVPISAFLARMLPWTRFGFAIMVVTGLLIFYSSPLRYYHNLFFRVKALFFVGAALNIWYFHTRTHARIGDWDRATVPPHSVRLAGAVSLIAWSAVVVSGRLIAYNWFDCDIQPQPEWVNWLAGCQGQGE